MFKKVLVLIICLAPLPIVASQDNKHVTAATACATANSAEKDLVLPDEIADAIRAGNSKTVSDFLDRNPAFVNGEYRRGDQSMPALTIAIRCNKDSLAKTLLLRKAHINSCDNYKATHLMNAVMHDRTFNFETINLLLTNKAAVNLQKDDGRTALYCAFTRGLGSDGFYSTQKIVRLLIDHGANPFIPDNKGKIVSDHLNVPNEIRFMQDINNEYLYRQSLPQHLHDALTDPDILPRDITLLAQQYLLGDKKIRPKTTEQEPIPVVIHYEQPMSDAMKKAIEADDLVAVQQEIKQNPSAVFSRFDEKTPLLYAAYLNKPFAARALIQRGSNVASFDGNYNNALYWAAFNGSPAMVAPLLRYMTYSQITHKAAGAHKTALEIAQERFEKTDKSEYKDVIHLITQRLEHPAPRLAPVMPIVNRQQATLRALTGLARLGCLQDLKTH